MEFLNAEGPQTNKGRKQEWRVINFKSNQISLIIRGLPQASLIGDRVEGGFFSPFIKGSKSHQKEKGASTATEHLTKGI
jgi:hypothetical protein